MDMSKLFVAYCVTEDKEVELIGAYASRKAATEALIDAFEDIWDGNKRPTNLDELNASFGSDWTTHVVETEHHS
jgi:hypothetical protein